MITEAGKYLRERGLMDRTCRGCMERHREDVGWGAEARAWVDYDSLCFTCHHRHEEWHGLTIEWCRSRYEVLGGRLHRKPGRSVRESQVGLVKGRPDKGTGAMRITAQNQKVHVHRILWAVEHGYWPGYLVHIDGDKSNNHIGNLRDASKKTGKRRKGKKV